MGAKKKSIDSLSREMYLSNCFIVLLYAINEKHGAMFLD